MLSTGIKSKPVYAPLRADTGGRYHVIVGLGAAAATALARVRDELIATDPTSPQRTQELFVADGGDSPSIDAIPTLLSKLRVVLQDSLMGTRLYVAGPEHFIGRVLQIALEFNLNRDEVRAEESGSRARRVHCIHCRTINEEITTNIVECRGCQRWLFVRDHYSRRLAAYMGVMVDAEAPGERPPLEEIYR